MDWSIRSQDARYIDFEVKRLKKLRWMVQTVVIIEEEGRLESEIRDIRKKLETEAWQRCRPFVLRDGDKNTPYFHYRASHRRKRNRIESLINSDGDVKVD